jgi:hypothetical protein
MSEGVKFILEWERRWKASKGRSGRAESHLRCQPADGVRLDREYGLPKRLRSDGGPPFFSAASPESLSKLGVWLLRLGTCKHGTPSRCPWYPCHRASEVQLPLPTAPSVGGRHPRPYRARWPSWLVAFASAAHLSR